MNNRLIQFLAAENITQSQFADSISVARASISHIIAGRNKPGYDFITAVMRHYPELNIEWLLCGKGKMYKEQRTVTSSDTLSEIPGFAPSESSQPAKEFAESWDAPGSDLLFNPEEFARNCQHHPSPARNSPSPKISQILPATAANPDIPSKAHTPEMNSAFSSSINASEKETQRIEFQRKITKIVIFFNDGTYQEFGSKLMI